MVGFLFSLLLVGLIAGFVARVLVPGRDAMGVAATMFLGIVGSFFGGFLGDVVSGASGEERSLKPASFTWWAADGPSIAGGRIGRGSWPGRRRRVR